MRKNPKLAEQRKGEGNPAYIHGMFGTRTYKSWQSMKGRCNNPNHVSYDKYGGRGIKVCSRWDNFTLFLEDMGERPKGKSLDRIDNNGDYEPSNCRWATALEQTANRSCSSEHVGVSFNKARNKWIVFLRGKYIGRSDTLEHAIRIRKEAEVEAL